jgi:hypothetical protein
MVYFNRLVKSFYVTGAGKKTQDLYKPTIAFALTLCESGMRKWIDTA